MSSPSRFFWAAVLGMAGVFAHVVPTAAQTGVQFNGTTQYVALGNSAVLGTAQFTLEVWVRRTGTGVQVSTGTGGLTNAVPLVTKGRGEGDATPNLNMNYFLGLNNASAQGTLGVLCADFENNAGGGNHPVLGVTPVPADGVWHHAAATYDGTTWRLYLDGVLDRTLTVNATPEASSIQHAGLGTAMTSTAAPAGFFAGDLDEARIWNVARSQCDIIASMNLELTSGTGLIGRWGLNDGTGTAALNSIGGSPNGTLTPTGTPPTWVAGSPFNAPVPPLPADPTGLTVNAPNPNQVQLSWTDVATTESGYEVERSTAGSGGPFSLLASLGPNSTSFNDFAVGPSTPYWYQVRATGSCGNSGYSAVETASTPAEPCNALAFSPTTNGGYAALGQAPSLGVSTFTLETWFRRTGTGVGTNTGSGGLDPILPLISKGMAEADGSTADMNYLFGIYTGGANPVIAADFEEGTGQTSPGLNHPVQGVTPILTDTWYHAAATFDGTTLRLYLNGTLEATVVVGAGRLPQSGSLQHAAIASALGTGGTVPSGQTQGFFAGQLDEARIWDVARTESEIRATINSQISAPTSNLVGRWGMNEITGTTVIATAGTTTHGTLVGSQPTQWDRVACAPFNISFDPPTDPSGLNATPVDFSQIDLTWTDNSTDETSFEIERSTTGIGGPYSFLAMVGPNTMSYSNTGLASLSEYCYQVRAVNGNGASAYAGPTCATTPGSALDFGSAATTYVTFGEPAALHLPTFTVEAWFRRDGAGTFNTTGSSGIPQAIPLVTKGAPESDNSNVDANYILCIDNATGTLAADYEEGAGQTSPGLNHPVLGSTPLTNGVWYHGAVTFDGNALRVYLNGTLDGELVVGALRNPRFDSIQHAALATMLTSTGASLGRFDGALDEVRVWDFARTQSEIQSTANAEITTPTTGLVARWALDEGTGTAVNGSAGTTVNGTITGANYTWSAAAPFNLSFTPPDPPSGLAATANTHSQITLGWTDLSTNESGFEIELSTTGIGGTYSLLVTAPANTTTYIHGGLAASTEHCYRIRAVNGSGQSALDGPQCATTLAAGNTALGFSGSTAQPSYATFGAPAALQLTAFTIEMWMRRDGAGEGTNTGIGGITDAIPLVAKGRADTETATADINYLFGIRASSGALCADFEEGAAGSSPSLNHPIEGGTPLALATWYHVAATYDGTALKLYLNGILDASIDVGQPLASASTVTVALASALTSAGAPAGFFNGVVDEVRIWNVARSQAQIQSTANVQIASPVTELVARWSLDEGSGTVIGASAGTTANGTITGPNYAWSSPGAPFNLAFNQQPGPPVLVGPANGATGVPLSSSLEVTASDADGGNLTVTYYGRTTAPTPGPDFTIIGLPDTQYYTGLVNGGTLAMFEAQTNWIVANRVSSNIVYVGQLGDCVERGDNGGDDAEWLRADQALSIIENPITTMLTDGIPYGVSVGNHDQSPIGNPDGTTTFYNQYFGTARFTGRAYYGGNYGSNNDNWYELFSASGMDFIVISFEYDTTPDAAVLAWADNLLATNSTRRAIILSHFICDSGNPGGFGPQGQAIYDALKSRPNLDVMLCGHVPGEGRRQDTFNGNTTHTMLSDYQGRTNGGSGWLRILEFSPANNEIRVKTYSPWLSQFENDGDSEFTLPYPMTSVPAFQLIGTVASVPSGSNGSFVWPGLSSSTDYEWYATVSDGSATTVGPVWSFTTGTGAATHTITATVTGGNGMIAPSGAVVVNSGSDQLFTFTPDAGYNVSTLTVDAVSVAVAPTYTFTNVTMDHTIDVQFSVNPAVDPVANLVASQVVPGTLGESTTAIQLNWDATPVGTTVEVWRSGFGSYPEYDDASGATPTVSSTYPPGAGWVKVDGLTTPGSNDLTTVRDFYYYVAYAQDGLGTWSPASAMTSGTLNYHLADVTNGSTAGVGNNVVNSVDVSLLGIFYGVTGGAVAAANYLDVGPTSTGYVDGRPLTDDKIEFEDLVMFAINYGLGVTGPAAPVARRAAVAGAAATSSSAELVVEAPSRVSAGEAVTARLRLRASETLIAVSARLEWDPAVVEPVSHAAGSWLIEREGQAFSPAPGAVDAAVMGGPGLAGEGELASVSFRVLSAGDPKVRIAALAGRDAQNRPVAIGSVLRPSTPVIPQQTRLAFARPNPFHESVTLGISLSKPGPVELGIYGVDGRRVRTLVQETREAGEYEVVWDGRDEHGVAARMGVYYARLITQQGRFTRRVTNLR